MGRPAKPVDPAALGALDWVQVQALSVSPNPLETLLCLDRFSRRALIELRKVAGIAPGDYAKIPLAVYAAKTFEFAGDDEVVRHELIVDAGRQLYRMKPSQDAIPLEPVEPEADEAPQETATASAVSKALPQAVPAAAQRALGDLMAALSQSMDEGKVRSIVVEMLGDATAKAAAALREELKRDVRTVEVKLPGEPVKPVGIQHKQFPLLLKLIGARKPNGDRLSIWIWGPAGSGKTRAAKEAAKALGLPFYLHGAAMSEHKFVGYKDAAGTYHATGFFQAWTTGGVCLFDEADANAVEAFLAVNAGLAGDLMDFPGSPEPVQRHPDCVLIVAANTAGHGATREYSGRMKQDAATLDRFVRVAWETDEVLERMMLPGFESWVARVQTARAKAKARNLEVIISPRASENGAALIAAGMTEDDAAELTYLSGLKPEQRQALIAA